jgi:putative ABC transport system permease protein
MDQPHGWIQVSVSATDRGAADELIARLRDAMPAGAKVQTPTAVGDEIKGQLDTMNIVLYFFSGVALFVGAFLILNSFNMTVLQRMRELGMLRTLGASRRKIVRIVLDEALLLAIAGTILGLAAGIGLAAVLVMLMRGLGWPIGNLHVDVSSAITASVVGIVVTLGAALWPARRAGRIAPIRAILGTAGVRRTPRPIRGVIGLACLLPGTIMGGSFWFSSDAESGGLAAMAGIAMTMAMFLGMALLAPFVIGPVVRLLGIPFRALFPAGGRLAVDALTANPMRTAATAAALTIGLSVVVVNASMSTSLMTTVSHQIEQNFARDFEIQARGHSLEDGGGPGVPTTLRARIAAMPETLAVTPVRSLYTDLPGTKSVHPGLIVGYDPAVYGLMDKAPIRGVDRAQALREVAAGGVLLGGTYADAAGLERGDTLLLTGAYGRHRARVVGVLDTISSFAGNTFQMSLATMEDVYGRTPDAQLAVKARSDAQATALQRRLDALVGQEYPNLELQSAAGARQEVEDEIAGQFNLFNGILAVAVLVSLLGVVNTLAMSVIERTREIGVLRALGASRWKVRRTMLDESLLITLAGTISGVGFGALIGWFWKRGLDDVLPGIAFHFPTGTTLTVAIAAVVLGTLAAILPARRAARLDVLDALKYE